MKNKLSVLMGLLVIASMALSACGGAAATEAPAAATSEVTLWHAYGTGSAEEVALTSLLEKAKTDLPNITINALQVPFNDIFNKYRTDVAAGGAFARRLPGRRRVAPHRRDRRADLDEAG